MAEETTTEGAGNAAAGTETGPAGTEETAPPEEAGMPEGAKKALAAARKDARDAEKARKALETRVQAFEQRDMSEQQKLEARAVAAEKAVADGALQLQRFHLAAEHGLDNAEAAYITGSTEAEMKASAKDLAARFGKGKTPSYDGGTRTTAQGKTDMNSLIRQAAGVE